MASRIAPFSIGAPGFYGLNTQDAPVGIDPSFALEATNCVIDKYGRIGSRKGWSRAHSANADLGSNTVDTLSELVANDGTRYTLAAGNNLLFLFSGGTLTKLTYGGGGVAPVITASNWQTAMLNGVLVFFQRGYDPLIFEPSVSTTQWRRMSERTGYTGSIPQANCAVSAYGRIWCADTSTDKNTVTWCDTASPGKWTAGTAGSLNLLNVWPQGGDEIVALAAHNNFLIIFGRKQTLIYSGANDPSTMALSDSLSNVGCISRKSVQNTGDDVLFLSDTGVRSLMRTIQEKSAPLRSVSKNIANDLQDYLSIENMDNIRSVYSPVEAFYLLTLPASSVTLCFDMKQPLQDGASRVTVWNGMQPKSFVYTKSRTLLMGMAGYIGTYSTYLDDANTYRMSYYTTWVDFGNPSVASILKKILFTIVGATNQTFVIKWGTDFTQATGYETTALTGLAPSSEYGIAEFGLAEFSGNLATNVVSINAGGTGKVIQIGFEAQVSSHQISIQKIDIFTKDGKLL
jgi:hypothetical protein